MRLWYSEYIEGDPVVKSARPSPLFLCLVDFLVDFVVGNENGCGIIGI